MARKKKEHENRNKGNKEGMRNKNNEYNALAMILDLMYRRMFS